MKFKKGTKVILIFLCFFIQLSTGNILVGQTRYPELDLSFYIDPGSLVQYFVTSAAFTAIFYYLSPIFENGFKYKRFLSFLILGFIGLSIYPAYLYFLKSDNGVQKLNLYYVGIGSINLLLAGLCIAYLVWYKFKKKPK